MRKESLMLSFFVCVSNNVSKIFHHLLLYIKKRCWAGGVTLKRTNTKISLSRIDMTP